MSSKILPDTEDLYSNSRIDVWRRCPMREHYTYIDKRVAGTEASAQLGIYTHENLEMIYEYCLRFNEGHVRPLPPDVLLAICVPMANEADGLEQTLRYQAGSLSLKYHNEYMPMVDKHMQVLGVEEKIVRTITTPKGRRVKFVQYVDLIYQNTLLHEIWAMDHKTAGVFWTQEQVNHDAQQATYIANLRHLGYPVTGVVVNNLLTSKGALKKPTLDVFQRFPCRPSPERVENVLFRLGQTIDRIIDGEDDPHMNYTKDCVKSKTGFGGCPFDGVCTAKMDGRNTDAQRTLNAMPAKPDSHAMRVRDRADFIERIRQRKEKLFFRAPEATEDDYDFVDAYDDDILEI